MESTTMDPLGLKALSSMEFVEHCRRKSRNAGAAIAIATTVICVPNVTLAAEPATCPYCAPAAVQARGAQLSMLRRLLWNRQFDALEKYFDSLQKGYEAGKVPDYELMWSFRAFRVTDPGYEPLFGEWKRLYPNSYAARVGAGTYHREVGYANRGSRLAAETSNEQFTGMNTQFRQAIQEYHESLALTAKPLATYNLMMRLGKAYGNADAIKSLLEKALQYDPVGFQTRLNYLAATTPRWGGSYAEMEAMIKRSEREGVRGWQLNALKAIVFEDRCDSAWREKRFDEALKHAKEWVGAEETFQSTFALARLLIDFKQYDEALRYINRGLEYYPNYAQLIAYRGYAETGQGNFDAAYRDYQRAADLGLTWAQRSVATALLWGRGVKRDRDQAVVWLKKAAARGDLEAMNQLSQLSKGEELTEPRLPAERQRTTIE